MSTESQFNPTWMYHKKFAPEGKVITSQEEFDALSDDWKDSPAAFDQESHEATEEPTGDKDQGTKEPDIKKVDLTALTVKELKDALYKNGVSEDELKGKKKDELIAMLGAP